ncbi:hypothetical protein [Pseudooceanicola sp.]|uniref:hypothetical protein n=1 Tax=Pseudooceanicola sp. TaxID=1914328 RepID=UPI003518F602
MGRDKKNEARVEHWTKMVRPMMETPAWRALSPVAQSLYPWIKLEWKGPQANNNGRIQLSVRQAAERMGVTPNTAARAFHDLQAKGFIVVIREACLGLEGKAKCAEYEITEIGMPTGETRGGRHLYKEWRQGNDFPVSKTKANNPQGKNGRE